MVVLLSCGCAATGVEITLAVRATDGKAGYRRTGGTGFWCRARPIASAAGGATTVPGLLVYRYDSPLFFANAEDFRRRALAAVAGQPEPVVWFVLNVEANVEVDSTGLSALDDLRAELAGRGVVFALARVKQDLLAALDAYGLTAAVGPERIYPTLPTAVEAYRDWRRIHPAPGR